MPAINQKRKLEFSDHFIEAYLVENAQDFPVAAGVVVNLSSFPMIVGGPVPSVVPGWKSTTLVDAIVSHADRIAVVRVLNQTDLGGIIFGEWDWFGDRYHKFPRTTPLYISRYDDAGQVELNPLEFSNQAKGEGETQRYSIRLNLWWSPANTDCYIHNEHPFMEIHTQIHGTGRIQKFRERDPETLYEEIVMAPGWTHDPFFLVDGRTPYRYPWHRYYSDSDAIWLAIEFHPAGAP